MPNPMTTTSKATETSGADNARAKLATIEAIYELSRFADHYDGMERVFELTRDAAELLEDAGYDFNHDDITADHIRDVAWDACRSQCLGVDYSATWSAGTEFDGQPDSFKVWLTVGGPSCYVTGDFGLRGAVAADSLRFWFSWSGATDFLWLSDAQREALQWFVDYVAV